MIAVLRFPLILLVGGARIVWGGSAVAAALAVAAVIAANPGGGGSPTPTPTATATPTPADGPQSCPDFPEFPDASCTGVPDGTTLTPHIGDLTINTDGQVIDSMDITGCIEVKAKNVTIKNSRITCQGEVAAIQVGFSGASSDPANPRLTVQDATIDCVGIPRTEGGAQIGVWGIDVDVLRAEIVHCSDGVFVDSDASVTDSWIHNMAWDNDPDGIHVDGIQATGGTNLTVLHNRIVVYDVDNVEGTPGGCTSATDDGGSCNASSAITSNNRSGIPPIDNWHVEYNLVGGGQATVYCSLPSATNSTIAHNRWMSGFSVAHGGQVTTSADCGDDDDPSTVDEVASDNLWADGPNAGQSVGIN